MPTMAEFSAVQILQYDFLTPFRDFARQAIKEIVESTPELRENDKWWADIEAYNQTHSTGNIIDTTGRRPDVNNFDHNGAAKWLMRMYTDPDGVLLNGYLLNRRSLVQVTGCHPKEYSSALAAYMDLRNNFLGHEGADAENMTPYDLLCHASLVIWLVDHLQCQARPAALQAMRASRDNVAAQCDPQNPSQYTTPQAELRLKNQTMDWACRRQEARRAAAPLRRDHNALEFEQWPVAEPMLIAPWESLVSEQIVFPSELAKGRTMPRTYTPYMPCPPTMMPQQEVEKAEPDVYQRAEILKRYQGSQTSDVENSIGYKAINLATWATAGGLLGFARGFSKEKSAFGNPFEDHPLTRDQAINFQDLMRGAIYDLKNGTDQPYTKVGWVFTVLFFAFMVIPDFISPDLMYRDIEDTFFYNFIYPFEFLFTCFMLGRLFLRVLKSKKQLESTNFMEPGLASALYTYLWHHCGWKAKLAMPFFMFFVLVFSTGFPALVGVFVACACGILSLLKW